MRKTLEDLKLLCANADEINRQNLKEILAAGSDTVFGREHGLSADMDASSFMKSLPISKYADYEGYIERIRRGGDNVLTTFPVSYWIVSSGTMGEQKHVPLSDEALCRYAEYMMVHLDLAGIDDSAPRMHASIIVPPWEKESMTITSAFFNKNDEWGDYCTESYVEGRELLFTDSLKKYEEIEYCKARIALINPGIQFFKSSFIYDLIQLFSYIRDHYEMLLSDIDKGEFSVELPEEVRKRISAFPHPGAERIEECRRVLSGDVKAYVPLLWKKAKLLFGVSGQVFPGQEEMLKSFCGEIPLFSFMYGSSECICGVAHCFNDADYILLPRAGFFELRPRDGGDHDTILPSEAEVGQVYELIYTTFSGLYRYASGDLLEITGFEGETPTFKMVGRTRLVFNITGEKMEYSHISSAMDSLRGRFWNDRLLFSVGLNYDISPAGYQIFAEGDLRASECCAFSRALDDILKNESFDYADLRGIGSLDMPRIIAVEDGAHESCILKYRPFNPYQRKPLQALTEEERKYMAGKRREE
ncbi:MAG: GH3 auxin-responsive promoter family protein [Lachnospiraceae bacterium]|nr:GH3 auxin-responsive promoter family protein [Lachnospiraceae bacterium]